MRQESNIIDDVCNSFDTERLSRQVNFPENIRTSWPCYAILMLMFVMTVKMYQAAHHLHITSNNTAMFLT